MRARHRRCHEGHPSVKPLTRAEPLQRASHGLAYRGRTPGFARLERPGAGMKVEVRQVPMVIRHDWHDLATRPSLTVVVGVDGSLVRVPQSPILAIGGGVKD